MTSSSMNKIKTDRKMVKLKLEVSLSRGFCKKTAQHTTLRDLTRIDFITALTMEDSPEEMVGLVASTLDLLEGNSTLNLRNMQLL